MQIETLQVAGIPQSIHAMRNPYDSWCKSDSHNTRDVGGYKVGPADQSLSMTLADAGPEHAKHLRMCMVWAEIIAPRYWWMQFDTYRYGVEKVSCSTMHTLMRHTLTEDDFEGHVLPGVLDILNTLIEQYKKVEGAEKKKEIWYRVIQNLPQSFLQQRTVMMSYQAIRAMYRQRNGHKLGEWAEFRRWAESLPESWMITDSEGAVARIE